jgi:alkylation response protein AidB-like acyl-CoA dehydrogenase
MDFSLTEDQRLMQEEMGKSLERICSLQRVREIAEAGPGFQVPKDVWSETCKLGIPALLIDQDHGGLGLGVLEAVLVAEKMGRVLAPVPYVASAVMAPLALSLAGTDSQQAEYLPSLARGERIAAVAVSEVAGGARADAGVSCRHGRLSGSSIFVLDCAGAALFIVADRERRLYLVHGESLQRHKVLLDTVDRTRTVCKIDFDNVPCEPLPVDPAFAMRRMLDAGRVVLAGDALGAAWTMLERAVEYAGQRKQFGRLIGSFQAVKHMCAEMAAELEPGRALLWYAAYAQDQQLDDAALASAHAKAYLADAARLVARKATEVHGGIGITDALGLHYWFKRIGWDYQVLGSPDRLREEAASLQGLVA